MTSHHSHVWTPITDLASDGGKSLSNPDVLSLVSVWQEQARELREKELYKEFLAKLQRQWAIETGAIEGLYTLSEGATLALIEKGLDASLISHEDTNQAPEEVILKILDQHHAIEGLFQFVSGNRELGTSYIKELHQVLTVHQDSYVGRDTLGNIVSRKLPKGMWKVLPNNVQHSDGSGFSYCPPEHVDQEMENLIAWHRQHESAGIPADVSAAWLHHRFTLIHPFTDGNGRIARCLATLVLLKARWLPLVVTRKERVAYIAAIRKADNDDLKPLVDFIGDRQKEAILEALSLRNEVVNEAQTIESILESVKAKFATRKEALPDVVRKTIVLAQALQEMTTQRIGEIAKDIQPIVTAENPAFRAEVFHGRHETNQAGRFHAQVAQYAKVTNYLPNVRQYQSCTGLTVRTRHETNLFFSFHGVGSDGAGVIGCAALAFIGEINEHGGTMYGPVTALAERPFEFTHVETVSEVQRRFQKWLNESVLIGLDYWRKSL